MDVRVVEFLYPSVSHVTAPPCPALHRHEPVQDEDSALLQQALALSMAEAMADAPAAAGESCRGSRRSPL